MATILRDKIIQNSAILFAEKGYENTSINDILKATKCSKGGLYHYFQSKMEILQAIIKLQIETYSEQFNAILDLKNKTAVENFNNLISLFIEFDEQGIGNSEFDIYFSLSSNDIFVASIIKTMQDTMVQVFEQIIEKGVINGEFKVQNPTLATKFIVRELTSMAEEIFRDMMAGKELEHMYESVDFSYLIIKTALGITDDSLTFKKRLYSYLQNNYEAVKEYYFKGEQ